MRVWAEILPEIVQRIDTDLSRIFVRKNRSDRQTALTAAALDYTGHDVIREVIQAVCGDEQLIESCAQNSESHPLGFDKFVLLTSPIYALRLHIWWPRATQGGGGDIHNHRFSFASAVIAGRIEVSSYRLGTPGRKMTQIVEGRAKNSIYKYSELGDVRVKRIATLAVGRGSAYYMDSTELHRVQMLDEDMSATLFIRSRDERSSTTLMTEGLRERAFATKREKLKVVEARSKLQAFVSAIG